MFVGTGAFITFYPTLYEENVAHTINNFAGAVRAPSLHQVEIKTKPQY